MMAIHFENVSSNLDQRTDVTSADLILSFNFIYFPPLQPQVCVISGASRGFGQAIAVRFVEEGAKVVCLSRSSCEETFKLIASIEGAPPVDDVALWVPSDISSEADCAKVTEAAAAKFGDKIHVLVNNAALFVFKSVEDATADDWDRSASVNIKGHALLTKAVLPFMKRAGGGSIVWQGSISAFLAQPNCATYSAMKGAICQLSRNCAYDLAKYNIRSNAVCAGTIETPISTVERADHGWTYDQWEKLKTKDVRNRPRRNDNIPSLGQDVEAPTYCIFLPIAGDDGPRGQRAGDCQRHPVLRLR